MTATEKIITEGMCSLIIDNKPIVKTITPTFEYRIIQLKNILKLMNNSVGILPGILFLNYRTFYP